MKSGSYSSSFTMVWAMAWKTATSVPGFWRSQRVAKSVISMRRGSMTMSLAPFWRTARFRKLEMTGWVSVVLLPVTMNASRFSISAMELDMALEPMESCRPVTEPAWHRRAQWSMLLVSNRARMSFWKT
jgi:hypothetical protein